MKTTSISNLVEWVISDKERYLAMVAHTKVLQTYDSKYPSNINFIPEPKKRSLSFIQLVLGIRKYRYWNVNKEQFE